MAEIVPVPGAVLGNDVEDQADAMTDAAARLAELLTAFGREPRRSLDAIAVFQALSRTAASMEAAAAELRRQEWFDLDDGADPEASAAWNGALEGLRSASGTFEWIATGGSGPAWMPWPPSSGWADLPPWRGHLRARKMRLREATGRAER